LEIYDFRLMTDDLRIFIIFNKIAQQGYFHELKK